VGKIGQLYTAGTWRIKAGMEAEFIEVWQAFAAWTAENQAGAGEAFLLQDPEDPRSFLSFSPWDRVEHIVEWRSRPEFQAFVRKARELAEELQPRNMILVGHADTLRDASNRAA
jgi:heme-degrading monooxygenase HmoA